jgi:hypothetical protein
VYISRPQLPPLPKPQIAIVSLAVVSGILHNLLCESSLFGRLFVIIKRLSRARTAGCLGPGGACHSEPMGGCCVEHTLSSRALLASPPCPRRHQPRPTHRHRCRRPRPPGSNPPSSPPPQPADGADLETSGGSRSSRHSGAIIVTVLSGIAGLVLGWRSPMLADRLPVTMSHQSIAPLLVRPP